MEVDREKENPAAKALLWYLIHSGRDKLVAHCHPHKNRVQALFLANQYESHPCRSLPSGMPPQVEL